MKELARLPFPLKAAVLTITPLGLIHLTISNIYAIVTGDYQQANYFHVLALDLVFPQLGQGLLNFWLSQFFWLVYIFWLVYFLRQRIERKKTTSDKQ